MFNYFIISKQYFVLINFEANIYFLYMIRFKHGIKKTWKDEE